MLIGHAKWKPVRLPEPTQCGLEAGVLVGTYSLCPSLMWELSRFLEYVGAFQSPYSPKYPIPQSSPPVIFVSILFFTTVTSWPCVEVTKTFACKCPR